MSTEENKQIARRFREELISTGNLALAAELLAEDYLYHGPDLAGEVRGREAFTQLLTGFRAAQPDMRETVEDQVAEGDRVAQRSVHRSTHQGDLMGVAPTGNAVTVRAIEILRIADGKIAETWVMFDALALLQQVGALPAPAPADG
jgi:steroid delta-isomerase-like uncharacterized protein